MGRYLGPKVKICKRFGVAIFDKVDRWAAHPGRELAQPKGKRSSKSSAYAEGLVEKQKFKHIYGIFERQFRRYMEKAAGTKGNTATALALIAESRLDNVLYRAGFAVSRMAARQLVNHGHVRVNDKKVDIPSFLVEPDMVITIAARDKSKKLVGNALAVTRSQKLPSWLQLDGEGETASVKVVNKPNVDEMEFAVDIAKIIELMSK
ncbi:MAG TPA: 30S ribosomal protein S4 [Planctomycetota bacterium]|jgi:small subunit ribosomal protein S4|nr:30S ribosomal protein S4 [Planctomycetota bacterium]